MTEKDIEIEIEVEEQYKQELGELKLADHPKNIAT